MGLPRAYSKEAGAPLKRQGKRTLGSKKSETLMGSPLADSKQARAPPERQGKRTLGPKGATPEWVCLSSIPNRPDPPPGTARKKNVGAKRSETVMGLPFTYSKGARAPRNSKEKERWGQKAQNPNVFASRLFQRGPSPSGTARKER